MPIPGVKTSVRDFGIGPGGGRTAASVRAAMVPVDPLPTECICTSYGTPVADELAALELYAARNLFMWLEADTYTGTTDVASFVDKVALQADGALYANARTINAAHAVSQATQANRPALPVADMAVSGRKSSVFGGAAYLDSNIGGSNFKFMHNGSDFIDVHVVAPTDVANSSLICATYASSSQGMHRIITSTAQVAAATYAASSISNLVGGTVSNGVATYIETVSGLSRNPDVIVRQDGDAVVAGDYGSTPSPSDPTATFCLGSRGDRAIPLRGRWVASYVANRFDAQIITNLRRLIFLKFGIEAVG